MKGLEPPRLTAPDPKSGVATNYTTSANELFSFFVTANINTFFYLIQVFFTYFIYFENLGRTFFFYPFLLLLPHKRIYIMELQGTVKKISDIQTFASGFQKREMVLMTEEQYPQPINIEFLQEKGDLLNNLKEGDKVKVSINLRGREWTSPQGEVKYFNSIIGWRIDNLGAANFNEPTHATPAESKPETSKNVFEEDEDDLPF